MVETNDRRLPAGIQSFEKIRKDGYLYVDKTDIIWQLANRNKTYNYLSRPRRFGKSVLVDTLEAYFMGKKELFEGLKIMQMETEWVKRPVIRLDMSRAGAEPGTLRSYLDITFDRLEDEYGITPKPTAQLADRFDTIIQTAYKQTGLQVAILIDEYDSPLQHSWKTPQHEACTSIYREVFAILKADDKYEKFVFITGITKFTQISLFSVLNNLSTIFNAIGCRVEVEKMIATGRIDMVVETTNFIYVLELKLSNNGGVDAATEQMKAKQYAEPFKADKRKVIALAIELDDMGKGLVDWKEV